MSMNQISRVGDIELGWGESLRWDDRRQRLYFVDCASQILHWLEGGEPPLHTLELPSLPTGVVLTTGHELIICLNAGLHVVDPDSGGIELLAAYPEGMHGRANDANADPAGNLVTGTLNLAPGPGAFWWFSKADGWRQIDEGIGNANGPVTVTIGGEETLVFGDTLAGKVYAYPYDPTSGAVGSRRVYADYSDIGGAPDGASADTTGRVWSCVLRAGSLARLAPTGLEQLVALPVPNPSDLAFAGPRRDRLYLTSIAADLGDGAPPDSARSLMVLDGLGVEGMPERRFELG